MRSFTKRTSIGLGINRRKFSGGIPFPEDLIFNLSERSDLTLVDSERTKSASILPSCIKRTVGQRRLRMNTVGQIDPVGTSFTLCGWVKVVDKSSVSSHFGKFESGLSKFGFITLTSGYVRAYFTTSGGTKYVTGTVDISGDWAFLLMEVDTSDSSFKAYVNGTQIGTTQTYTGAYEASVTTYFGIGYQNEPRDSRYGDIMYFERLLTAGEKTTLLAHGYTTGAEMHLTCHSDDINDVSGNENHIVSSSGGTAAVIEYESGASRYLLDYGYDVYGHWSETITDFTTSAQKTYYVPLTQDGTSVTNPILLDTDANKIDTNIGNSTKHNLAPCKLRFTDASMDRSNATIYKDEARLLNLDKNKYYDSGNASDWHISEMNKQTLLTFLNESYKNILFTKFVGNSYSNRDTLSEIILYATNKTGTDVTTVLNYCGDVGVHAIEYELSTDNILAINGTKWLKYDDAGTLSLSTDNGATYPTTLDISADEAGGLVFAWIYDDGNILFCSHDAAYYSDDSLATYKASTVLDVTGAAFTPSTYDNFKPANLTPPSYDANGDELLVWGTYSVEAGTVETNINVWYSYDGSTIKSAFKGGVGDMPSVRHIHGVTPVDDEDNAWVVWAGDSNAEINVVKIVYNITGDSWSLTSLYQGTNPSTEDKLKIGGMTILNGQAIWSVDQSAESARGIYKTDLDDIADDSTYTKLYYPDLGGYNDTTFNATEGIMWTAQRNANDIAVAQYLKKAIVTSIDGGSKWVFTNVMIDIALNYSLAGAFLQMTQPDSNGTIRCCINANGENYRDYNEGSVLLFKIIKP